jgi:hypothetical protein
LLRVEKMSLQQPKLIFDAKETKAEQTSNSYIPPIGEYSLCCPISFELLEQPVLTVDGNTYSRNSIIMSFVAGNNESPLTNLPLASWDLLPNKTIEKIVSKYKYMQLRAQQAQNLLLALCEKRSLYLQDLLRQQRQEIAQLEQKSQVASSSSSSLAQGQDVSQGTSSSSSSSSSGQELKKVMRKPVFVIPENLFYCPITDKLMVDPVAAADGNSYERKAITDHIEQSRSGNMGLNSPVTGAPLQNSNLIPNHLLRSLLQEYRENIAKAMEVDLEATNREKLKVDLLLIQTQQERIKKLRQFTHLATVANSSSSIARHEEKAAKENCTSVFLEEAKAIVKTANAILLRYPDDERDWKNIYQAAAVIDVIDKRNMQRVAEMRWQIFESFCDKKEMELIKIAYEIFQLREISILKNICYCNGNFMDKDNVVLILQSPDCNFSFMDLSRCGWHNDDLVLDILNFLPKTVLGLDISFVMFSRASYLITALEKSNVTHLIMHGVRKTFDSLSLSTDFYGDFFRALPQLPITSLSIRVGSESLSLDISHEAKIFLAEILPETKISELYLHHEVVFSESLEAPTHPIALDWVEDGLNSLRISMESVGCHGRKEVLEKAIIAIIQGAEAALRDAKVLNSQEKLVDVHSAWAEDSSRWWAVTKAISAAIFTADGLKCLRLDLLRRRIGEAKTMLPNNKSKLFSAIFEFTNRIYSAVRCAKDESIQRAFVISAAKMRLAGRSITFFCDDRRRQTIVEKLINKEMELLRKAQSTSSSFSISGQGLFTASSSSSFSSASLSTVSSSSASLVSSPDSTTSKLLRS